MQYYSVEGSLAGKLGIESAKGIYGVDLFIGLPELWDKGISTAAFLGFVEYLFVILQADLIIIDPIATNSRAIRCYEKCGFKMKKLLPGRELHEGEYRYCRPMAIKRDDFAGAN